MDIAFLRIAVTVVSFACFVGICAWTWSKRNASAFEQAATLPFEQD